MSTPLPANGTNERGGTAPPRPRVRLLNLVVLSFGAGLFGVFAVTLWTGLWPSGFVTFSDSLLRRDWNTTVADSGPTMRLFLHSRMSAMKNPVVMTIGGGNATIPHWACPPEHSEAGGVGRPTSVVDLAIGWPWPAMRYRYEQFTDDSNRTTGGWRLSPTWVLAGVVEGEPTIPLIPILPGLLANVAVIGGAAVAPLAILRLWRTRSFDRRRRLGKCVRCHYDLRTGALATCPECGTVAPPMNAA